MEAFIVNAFSEVLGGGNPAGVVILSLADPPLEAAFMQAIAKDVGKSETAFVSPGESSFAYRIRWYSPTREMPLCGHATLAAASILFETAASHSLSFGYAAGTINVVREEDGLIFMRFPLDRFDRIPAPGEQCGFFDLAGAEDCLLGRSTKKLVLVLDAGIDLEAIRPDFHAMRTFLGPGSEGICLTKPSGRADFESRYFNPWAGVDEDPVTGSVHTLLARYWSTRLGKDRLHAWQASQRP